MDDEKSPDDKAVWWDNWGKSLTITGIAVAVTMLLGAAFDIPGKFASITGRGDPKIQLVDVTLKADVMPEGCLLMKAKHQTVPQRCSDSSQLGDGKGQILYDLSYTLRKEFGVKLRHCKMQMRDPVPSTDDKMVEFEFDVSAGIVSENEDAMYLRSDDATAQKHAKYQLVCGGVVSDVLGFTFDGRDAHPD